MSMEIVSQKVRSAGAAVTGAKTVEELNEMLRFLVDNNGSDLHVTPDQPPIVRVHGVMSNIPGTEPMTGDTSKAYALGIMTPNERKRLEEEKSVDLAYAHPGIGRFRINVFTQTRGISIAARHIKDQVGSFEDLGLPEQFRWIAELRMGLVLFTGPTGSGKSTSMAAIIELINRTRIEHIITLEQPIEYLFENKQCLIQQREVGKHTPSFQRGLRDAMREDPDIILCGELRDMETAMMAIQGAETGHLVIGTLHTNTCANAVSRLIDIFPEAQQQTIQVMLADTLKAVINQRLIPSAEGKGRALATEYMKVNSAIANLVRENKTHQIPSVLATSKGEGMWAFEQSLVELFRKRKITSEQAYSYAPDKKVYQQLLGSKAKQQHGH